METDEFGVHGTMFKKKDIINAIKNSYAEQ